MLGIPTVEDERRTTVEEHRSSVDPAKPAKAAEPGKRANATKPPKASQRPKSERSRAGSKSRGHRRRGKKTELARWARRRRRTIASFPKRFRRGRRRARLRIAAALHRRSYVSTLEHLPSREELPILLNRRGLVGTGAELGVKKGGFSQVILKRWQGRRLISIDPWLAAEPEEYVDRANVGQDQHEQFYRRARDLLANFGNRSEIWRLTSLEAAKRISSHSLDFVFIDARHDYESVLEDLDAWFDKVRPGGVLAGHDYANGEFTEGVFGVKRAVDEFFAARELQVHVTRRPDPRFPSWFVEIPSPAEGDGRSTDAFLVDRDQQARVGAAGGGS